MRAILYLVFAGALAAQTPGFEVRVVDDASGAPLPSAGARLQKMGLRELSADLDTGRDGIARADGLAQGEYTLTVSKANYVRAQLRVRIPSERLVVRLVHFGILSGQVTDARGRGVPGRISAPYGRTIGGARIQILTKSEGAGGFATFKEVEIGDEGRWRIYDLPPGQYAVGLWYDGLAVGAGMALYPDTAHPRWFTIGGGEEHTGIDFQVTPRSVASVSGRVTLPKPKTTFALALGLPEQPLLPIAQTLTEEDGSFKFERVPAGTYDLFVAGPDVGYGARMSLVDKDALYAKTRISIGASDVTDVEVAVAPGKSVVVTLGKGKAPEGCPPSVGVATKLLEPWAILFSTGPQSVSFGKETTIPGLPPGKVEISASNLTGNCYAANRPVVDLGGDGSGPVTLELASAGSIRGTLRGAPKPSDYTVVLLESDASSDAEARVAAPDAEGRFSFDSLKPAKYRIAARPNGERSRWIADPTRMTEIQIPGGSTTDIDLPAPPKGDRQ